LWKEQEKHEAHQAFRPCVAIHEESRGYHRGNRGRDPQQSLETGGVRATRMPKGFSVWASVEWETYATKQVRPIFVEEAAEILVVTVYTYYF